MPATVRIPLSWANNVLGVSGVEDVTFEVLTVDDILEAVEDAAPQLPDIEAAIADATVSLPDIEEELALLQAELEAEIPSLDLDPDQLVDDIVQGVTAEIAATTTVEIEGSLFSLERDLVDILAAALEAVAFEPIDGFPDLDSLQDELDTVVDAVEAVDVPTLEDIQQAATDGFLTALEELPGGSLLTDPDQFIDGQLERLGDRLVSDDAAADAQQTLEDIIE